jgi:hypothetical protein
MASGLVKRSTCLFRNRLPLNPCQKISFEYQRPVTSPLTASLSFDLGMSCRHGESNSNLSVAYILSCPWLVLPGKPLTAAYQGEGGIKWLYVRTDDASVFHRDGLTITNYITTAQYLIYLSKCFWRSLVRRPWHDHLHNTPITRQIIEHKFVARLSLWCDSS